MKLFLAELFRYHHRANQDLVSALTGTASSECLRLLCHIVNVHQIWNSRILPHLPPRGPWEEYPLETVRETDSSNLEQSLRILDRYAPDKIIRYTTFDGRVFDHSVGDLLFQAINHGTYHRGQLAMLFRKNGMEPLVTDFIYYKMH